MSDTRVVSTDSEAGTVVVRGHADEAVYFGETVTDFDVTATVTEQGLVRELVVRYDDGDASVRITLVFENVGETSVRQPDWYDEAVNATGTGNGTTDAQ